MEKQKIVDDLKGRDNQIKRFKQTTALMEDLLVSNIDLTKVDIVYFYDEEIAFRPNNLNQLHYVRKFLRKWLGKWDDENYSIDMPTGECYNSLEAAKKVNAYVLIRYRSKLDREKYPKQQLVEIWLDMGINDMPKELLKGGKCGFVEKATTKLSFACEVK